MPPTYFPSTCNLSVTAAIALLAISGICTFAREEKLLRSPRDTLQTLSEEEKAKLPYPPDALPGARDVNSPYGTFRCYEWGPTTGRFVLFVHGISTPSLALYPLAKRLVDHHSCRVLLIDLWGRGYSDMPADLPQDARLFTTQILLALVSSPVSWTGSGAPPDGFDLMGYSLGGGIAANFAANFPGLVRSLTLFTPAGLIRPQRRSWMMRLLYSSGLVPSALLRWLVKHTLSSANATANVHEAQNAKSGTLVMLNPLKAASEELPKTRGQDVVPLIDRYPHVDVAAAVNWQLTMHPGFVPSFISSIRHAPSIAQQEVWRHITAGARKTKVLIFAGSKDCLILADELHDDALAVIGSEHLTFKVLDCGHELPITCADQVSADIGIFWALDEGI